MLILTFVEQDNIFRPSNETPPSWSVWPPLCGWIPDKQRDGLPLATRARARLAQLGSQCTLPPQELWCLAALATQLEHKLIEDGDPDRVEPSSRRVGLVLHLTDLAAHTFFDVLKASQGQRSTLVALADDGLAKWMHWLANELDKELGHG